MAIKAGDLPLVSGAPTWLASRAWSYVPFLLVTFYLVLAISRLRRTTTPELPMHPKTTEEPPREETTIRAAGRASRFDILPEQVSRDYLSLKLADCTDIQEARFLRQYMGKWIDLELQLFGLTGGEDTIRAQLYPVDADKPPYAHSPIFVYFDDKWEDHLQHLKMGDMLKFRAKIAPKSRGVPTFRDAEPISA
jgi:hypothetical protein